MINPVEFLKEIKKRAYEKGVVKQNAIREGEQIFKKTNPGMAMKDGSFPKTGPTMSKAYNAEANRIQKQVVNTRLEQYKKNPKVGLKVTKTTKTK